MDLLRPREPSPAPGRGSAAPGWLPNVITILRLLLVPVFWFTAARAATEPDPWAGPRLLALAVLVALCASDVVDGWIARRFGLATPLGALLDAVADKVAQVAILAFFVGAGGGAFAPAPWWFFGLLVVRDLLLLVGWVTVRRTRGRVEVVHEPHGKLASFLVFALLVLLTVGAPPAVVDVVALSISVLVVASTTIYVAAGWRQLARP